MKKKYLASLYVLINYLFCFVYLFKEIKLITYLNIGLGAIAFIYLAIAQASKNKDCFFPIPAIVFLAILVSLMLINILIVQNYTLGNIIGVVLSQCVLGLYLLRFEIHKPICYLIFYSFVGLIVLVLTGILNVGSDSWEFFASTSRNYVSFFLIYALFPLCISNAYHQKKLPLLPLTITLLEYGILCIL